MAGLLPPLLLALYGAWCGTFAWGPAWAASTVAALALLGTLFWAAPSWQDPLRLGASGRLLPAALWIAGAASAWASPVPRAAWSFLLLSPAFLALPGAVERCWRREEERRRGLRALALVAAGVSLWSLVDWGFLGSPRAAMPLGHHNLLAAWLVIVLPLAVLPAREPGRWRLAGFAAGGLVTAAVLASRSLGGCVALVAVAGLGLAAAAARSGKARPWRTWGALLVVAVALSLAQAPRVLRIASGGDPSVRARSAYLAAGIRGFAARPMLGWGPGSTPWTAAAFLDPVPGINPWGESVGDLHSLSVQLAYELGVTGFLLAAALAVLFCVRRIAEREEGRDPALLLGGMLGLAGGAVASLGSGAVAVTALPLAAAIAAGAALAGSGRGKARRSSPLPVRIYAAAALLALIPTELARWHYDRAVAAAGAGRATVAETELASAMRFDPTFPLYPLRLALLRAGRPAEKAAAADLAWQAAKRGKAVPSLWLMAGILGYSAQRPWAGGALEAACTLDPLDPFPPFYALLVRPGDAGAPVLGAQALLAEPRLAAAVFWGHHPDLLARSLTAVGAWPGVDDGWKAAFAGAVASLPPAAAGEPLSRLALGIDDQAPGTISLTAFRRRPWPLRWDLIAVRQPALERLRVPPAAASTGTSAEFFQASPCRRRAKIEQLLLTR
jgi:hypothetical protein